MAAEKEKDAVPQVEKESVTKTETGKPSVEPADPAPGKPKVDETAPPGQKLADGGGGPVFMNTPLVKGIPVGVPVNEGTIEDKYLTEGVALAAPVVPGTPEMISNAQAEFAVENPTWKKGDLVGAHHVNDSEIHLDIIDSDGSKVTKKFRGDSKQFKALSEAMEKGKNEGKKFAASMFTEADLIEDEV